MRVRGEGHTNNRDTEGHNSQTHTACVRVLHEITKPSSISLFCCLMLLSHLISCTPFLSQTRSRLSRSSVIYNNIAEHFLPCHILASEIKLCRQFHLITFLENLTDIKMLFRVCHILVTLKPNAVYGKPVFWHVCSVASQLICTDSTAVKTTFIYIFFLSTAIELLLSLLTSLISSFSILYSNVR